MSIETLYIENVPTMAVTIHLNLELDVLRLRFYHVLHWRPFHLHVLLMMMVHIHRNIVMRLIHLDAFEVIDSRRAAFPSHAL